MPAVHCCAINTTARTRYAVAYRQTTEIKVYRFSTSHSIGLGPTPYVAPHNMEIVSYADHMFTVTSLLLYPSHPRDGILPLILVQRFSKGKRLAELFLFCTQ